jgi:hypothetical protein
MINLKDIEVQFTYKEPFNTYSHIYSKDGECENITVLSEARYQNQPVYIVIYNGKKYMAIFNFYVCEYFTDDIYGEIYEDE